MRNPIAKAVTKLRTKIRPSAKLYRRENVRVAQWTEREISNLEAAGSNPVTDSTLRHRIHPNLNLFRCEDGVIGSMTDCESVGRGSNPHLTPKQILC